jgi:hypothetical protein
LFDLPIISKPFNSAYPTEIFEQQENGLVTAQTPAFDAASSEMLRMLADVRTHITK